MDIAGRTALVAGGASGLGLASVRALAERGARVVVLDLDSPRAKSALADLPEGVKFCAGDVTATDDVTRAVDRAVELGDLAIVHNCAGIATPGRMVSGDGRPFDLEVFRRVVEVNLVGTFNVVRLAAQAIVADTPTDVEDRAVIINTASIAAFDGQIGQAAYAASKGGVVALTLPLARELARHRIRVVAIAPGVFHTPMLDGLPPQAITALNAAVLHPARLGDPAEFALLVSQIIANPMLNGEVIRLDGAVRMGPR